MTTTEFDGQPQPCYVCDEPFETDGNGVTYHVTEDGERDFEADSRHVPYGEQDADDHGRVLSEARVNAALRERLPDPDDGLVYISYEESKAALEDFLADYDDSTDAKAAAARADFERDLAEDAEGAEPCCGGCACGVGHAGDCCHESVCEQCQDVEGCCAGCDCGTGCAAGCEVGPICPGAHDESIDDDVLADPEDSDDNDEDGETCSDPFGEGCEESLSDGEGWDGACGSCADRVENEREEAQRREDEARERSVLPTLVYVPKDRTLLKFGANATTVRRFDEDHGDFGRRMSVLAGEGKRLHEAALNTDVSERAVPEAVAAAYGHATGRCLLCGKPLSSASSQTTGYGPECRGKL